MAASDSCNQKRLTDTLIRDFMTCMDRPDKKHLGLLREQLMNFDYTQVNPADFYEAVKHRLPSDVQLSLDDLWNANVPYDREYFKTKFMPALYVQVQAAVDQAGMPQNSRMNCNPYMTNISNN